MAERLQRSLSEEEVGGMLGGGGFFCRCRLGTAPTVLTVAMLYWLKPSD
jgi:hypothetical protein